MLSMPAISDLIDLIAFDEIAVVSDRACAASARFRTSACSRSLSSFLTRKSFSRCPMYSPRSIASASAAPAALGNLFLLGHRQPSFSPSIAESTRSGPAAVRC